MNSIRLRLLLWLGALLLLAALVMAGITYRSVLAETEALFDYQLRQMALSLRDQGAIDSSQAQALADEDLDFVVQIWTLDGRSVYASRLPGALPERAYLGLADVQAGGQVWRTFGVMARGRVIQVAQPAAVRARLATQAAVRSVQPLAWVALPMGLLLWWLISHLLHPLRRLANDVGQRDAASLQALPLDRVPDEAAPLVQALNQLLARLAQSLQAQRDFVADAAHELRSPLTALKLQLRLLGHASNDAERQHAQQALADGIDRAARLVEQLLALARAEPGAAHASPLHPLDLTELVRQALADTLTLAQARGTELVLQADTPVTLTGDRAGLTALVRNLADNALRYSPPGSLVQLSLHPGHDGDGPRLVVEDSGPGIASADHARVFDRFYRHHPDGQVQGSGLGLAIVQAVAQRHQAQLHLGSSTLGGLRVEVVFAAQTTTVTG